MNEHDNDEIIQRNEKVDDNGVEIPDEEINFKKTVMFRRDADGKLKFYAVLSDENLGDLLTRYPEQASALAKINIQTMTDFTMSKVYEIVEAHYKFLCEIEKFLKGYYRKRYADDDKGFQTMHESVVTMLFNRNNRYYVIVPWDGKQEDKMRLNITISKHGYTVTVIKVHDSDYNEISVARGMSLLKSELHEQAQQVRIAVENLFLETKSLDDLTYRWSELQRLISEAKTLGVMGDVYKRFDELTEDDCSSAFRYVMSSEGALKSLAEMLNGCREINDTDFICSMIDNVFRHGTFNNNNPKIEDC